MSATSAFIQDNVLKYIMAMSLREPQILSELRVETGQMERFNMQIAPEQGQLMRMLVAITGAKRIIEVGTFTGYSTLCMALSIPEDGKITACDINEEWTSVARRYWDRAGVDHKIELKLAPATSTLKNLIDNGESGKVDLMFIDADKENYDAYYELGLILLRQNGLILVDNTLWSGDVLDESINDVETQAIRELNQKISQDDRVESFLLPLADGLTMVRKL